MKIYEAYYCNECEELMSIPDYDKDFNMVHCYKCGSKKVIPLNQWLYKNRRPEKSIRQTPTAKYRSMSTDPQGKG
ncbi:MAG: hypothetical protein DDT41_01821 [candidate division WS2 bacterium]|nr:hypothetical protein [Candidatus Psychracetigena formicireducens]